MNRIDFKTSKVLDDNNLKCKVYRDNLVSVVELSYCDTRPFTGGGTGIAITFPCGTRLFCWTSESKIDRIEV